MSSVRTICTLLLAGTFLLVGAGTASARRVRSWSFQELLDKSDLVAIVTPTATSDTKERVDLPGLTAQRVVGIETTFSVSAVFKGDKMLKEFVLHHYRLDGETIPNGPTLISFAPNEKTYLVFLVREPDGRYSPTVGQVDPGMHGIRVLGDASK